MFITYFMKKNTLVDSADSTYFKSAPALAARVWFCDVELFCGCVVVLLV